MEGTLNDLKKNLKTLEVLNSAVETTASVISLFKARYNLQLQALEMVATLENNKGGNDNVERDTKNKIKGEQ